MKGDYGEHTNAPVWSGTRGCYHSDDVRGSGPVRRATAAETSGAIGRERAGRAQRHCVERRGNGCNRLTGPFTVKANKGLSFGDLAVTRMACPDTSEVEQRFHAALKGTSHWSIVKDRLELYGATGKPLAVFEKRTEKSAVKLTPA